MDIGVDWVVVWILLIMFGFFYTVYEYLKATIERYERVTRERHESLIDNLKGVNDKLYAINCNLNSIETGAGAGGQLHGNLRDTASSLKVIEGVVERLLVKSGG